MNIPKNVNDILPPGLLNNIISGGASGMNIPRNPLDAVNDILPTGMLKNIIPGSGDVISVVLDSPNNAYYAGTVVSGRVIVQMDKPENIRSLSVRVQGGAHVTWDETKNETKTFPSGSRENLHNQESVTTTFSSKEEYFNNKFNILGETQISAGTQTYQFSSPLPPLLPSSFSGDYGNIKYTVKATIDRAWKFDQTAELEFKVVTPMDLNHNAAAKEPVKQEVSKSFCCLFCQSGPLTLVAALPHSGFVAGQSINVAVEADNASTVHVNNVVIKLNKTITWTCHDPSRNLKEKTTELAKVSMEGVDPRASKIWSQQLVLPADMPFINIDACSIIKMKHILQVVAEVSGCHQNLSLEIPLILGSVPIQTGGGISPMFPNPSPNSGMGDTSIPAYPAMNIAPGIPSYPSDVNGPPQGGYQQPGQFYSDSTPSAPPVPTYPIDQPLLSPTDVGFKIAPANPPYPT